ncbi:hypothetical protein ABE218_08620 [Bacillus smithii]|uniref:hypothetical protein n=1 Tax=Bacillus smithii TaxID=1479 RepID=UPI003D223E3E
MNTEQRITELEKRVADLEKNAATVTTADKNLNIESIIPSPISKERIEGLVGQIISPNE